MRKKLFCAALTAALIAMQVVPVSAASTLPVTNANKYTVSVTGGGVTNTQCPSPETLK